MSGVSILTNVASGYRMLVEIAWVWDPATDSSGWTWTDVTTDVWQPGNVTITIGRANEASVTQPGNCSLRLKNPTGAYTPANPVSVNYPHVVLGVPLRVSASIDGGSVWRVRFFGYISSWAPGWDAQGKFAYVAVTGSGTTRRLGAGNKPLRSALERAVSTDPLSIEYWPMEDGVGSTQIASALAGRTPASFSGLTLASNTDLTGSAALPTLTSTGSVSGAVTVSPSSTSWQWDWHYLMPAAPSGGADTVIMQINTTGTVATWQYIVWSTGGGFNIHGYDSSGTKIVDQSFSAGAPNPAVGSWVHESLFVQDGAGTISWGYTRFPSLGGSTGNSGSFTLSGVAGRPTSWSVPNSAGIDGMALGHVVLYDSYNYTQPGLPAFGYVGETVDDRLYRLCITEEGIPLNRIGAGDIRMGAQSVDTLMNLLRECETADGGVLFDGLQQDLTYVSRNSLYNQSAALTLDANSGQVPAAPGPLPIFDDQRILNRITVTRTSGSFVVDEDEDGPLGTAVIGVRDGRVVVNTETDGQLTDIASWRVHLGTADGMRYPQVMFDLAAAPELASAWVVSTIADRIDLTNLSNRLTQHPAGTVSLLIEGWTEILSSRLWRVAVNTSQFRPWEVFQIQDSRLGRIETDGSTLNSSATSSAVSLSVASSGGLWATGVAFDLDIEGEQVTATFSGSSSPQTAAVTRSVNGVTKVHSGGAVVKLWKPGVLAL